MVDDEKNMKILGKIVTKNMLGTWKSKKMS
jgi:hypothetical protein